MSEKNCNESKTRSKITTNSSPTKNSLTSPEICEIIKQCGESGVIDFEFNELHISFQARKVDCQDHLHTQSPGQGTAISRIIDEDSLIMQDEMMLKDLELEELKLQDPLQYETLLAEQELV